MTSNASRQKTGMYARIQPWIQAARPAAYPIIVIPLLFGQAVALRIHGEFRISLFFYTLLFGALYQIYLLYINDYADSAIDKTNAQFWLSGGSRVIPQNKLKASDLLVGSRIAFTTWVALTLFLAVISNRPWMPVSAFLAVALCLAYNLPPLQLSYRGHGEILQGLGCGVLLPLTGFYMQFGSLREFPLGTLIALYLIFHAGNIITALPDYVSDTAGSKKTFPVRYGEFRARTSALFLLALAHVCVLLSSLQMSPAVLALIVIPSSLILLGIIFSGVLKNANVSEFPTCKRFVTWASASQAWLLCAWTGAQLLGGSS